MHYDSGKRRRRLFSRKEGWRPPLPISLLVLAVLVFLFSLIPPSGFFTAINPSSVKVPAFTPTPTPLPRPTDVHGGHIVFTCTRSSVNQICLINADGTGYRQLTRGTSNSYYPAVSRDGQTAVFAVNQADDFDLFKLMLGTINMPQTPEFEPSQLTFGVGNAFSPSFSPDGSQIVFVNRVGNAPSALWIMGRDGEKPHALYAGAGDIVGAAWSPDGQTIAFAMAVDSRFAYEVFLLNIQDAKQAPRQVSHGPSDIGGSISWAPDQTALLIFAGPAAAREIYRLDIKTGATAQLTFGGNNAAGAFSPDGQFIVFNSLRNNGQADLYIMRADGHSTRQLTNNPEPDWQPQWAP
jgi:Tol biopolymer transport system component